jgi:hypothetical protein
VEACRAGCAAYLRNLRGSKNGIFEMALKNGTSFCKKNGIFYILGSFLNVSHHCSIPSRAAAAMHSLYYCLQHCQISLINNARILIYGESCAALMLACTA